MTKEELNNIKSDDLPFMEALNKLFSKAIDLKSKDWQIKLCKTRHGNYLWKVNDRIWDIKQNIEDVKLIQKLIAAHNPEFGRLDRSSNAGRLIRYDYENFFLRMGKMKDLFLLLINEVMMLNVKKGLGFEKKVLALLAIKYPNFSEIIWADIKKYLDKLKPYRNHLAHNGNIQLPDLALIDSYYTVKVKHKNLLEELRHESGISHVQKELVEKFTGVIESWVKNIDQFLKLIYIFLYNPFIENVSTLIKEGN